MRRLTSLLVLVMATAAWGSDPHGQAPAGQDHSKAVTSSSQGHGAARNVAPPTGPEYSSDVRWSWPLAIVIGALFIAAAVIGPIYRTITPEEKPADDHHDDAHGHHDSHGHHDAHGGHGHH